MGIHIDQKIVIVTRRTRLDDVTALHNTAAHARFMKVRARQNMAKSADAESLKKLAVATDLEFSAVEQEASQYRNVVAMLRQEFDFGIPVQVVDRQYLPSLVLGPTDVVVTVGQDGLVANAAKYAVGHPIIGINPNPAIYDGVLLPFQPQQARSTVMRVLKGQARVREVTLAEARLNDGQRLLAFNDLFIGARTHVSARYLIDVAGKREPQSSSGILVSTGAGSTGWLSSVLNMTTAVAGNARQTRRRLSWEDRRLVYVVREPFVSKRSQASIVTGELAESTPMVVESMMSTEGVIFSDGVESDFLAFGEGAVATISLAPERARLVVG